MKLLQEEDGLHLLAPIPIWKRKITDAEVGNVEDFNNKLIEISKEFFKEKGYSLGVDWPYSGSIVPLHHYQKTKNVSSIMLEINRALYLNEPGNQKSNNYIKTKQTVTEYLKILKTAFDYYTKK